MVLAFFTAYFTEDDFLTQHVWAGYVAGAVVCIRLLWGFVGTQHARFTDFVRSPRTALGDLGEIVAHRARRHVGHNPAGGAMIVALLLGMAGTVFSGLMLYAIEERARPLASWVAEDPAASAWSSPSSNPEVDDEDRGRAHDAGSDDGREEFWEEIHELLVNFMLPLIGLHIAGVLLGSYAHQENLIQAMFTARKRPEAG